MSMTHEEAIEFLSQYINDEVYTKKCIDAHNLAISALRLALTGDHFREATKMMPLTLEQLREMDGQPVWVQTPGIERYGRWVIVAGVDTDNGQQTLYCQGDYTCRDYGKTWLAYAYPPAHIDREAWERCWTCRWVVSQPNWRSDYKFCPRCGKPLTEEAWAELEKRMGARA